MSNFDLDTIKAELSREIGSMSTVKSRTPKLAALIEAAEAGQVGDGSPMLSVTVTGLVDLLNGRKNDIAAVYGAVFQGLDEEDARRGNEAEAFASFLQEWAAAARDTERFRYDVNTGQLIPRVDGAVLPSKPSKVRAVGDVDRSRQAAKKALDAAVAPFDAQLALLDIASEPNVDIQQARVAELLRTPVPTAADLSF